MTAWADLQKDIFEWLQRDQGTDVELQSGLSAIIRLGQLRCLRDLEITAFNDEKERTVGIGDRFFNRPELMTALGSVLANINGVWTPLEIVTRDFVAEWQSLVFEPGAPVYTAIWDDDNLVVAPIPDQAYSIRVQCRREVELLGPDKLDNELSFIAYDILLMSCLGYACTFSQEDSMDALKQQYEGQYAALVAQFMKTEADVVAGSYNRDIRAGNNS